LIETKSVIGNIKKDQGLEEVYRRYVQSGSCESITLTRFETPRTRMRRESDKGTKITILLPSGTRLKDGDVLLLDDSRMIVVKVQAEDTGTIRIRDGLDRLHSIEVAMRVGHALGNLHRPLIAEGDRVYFPIQAESELENIRKSLLSVGEYLEFGKTVMVIEDEQEMAGHDQA